MRVHQIVAVVVFATSYLFLGMSSIAQNCKAIDAKVEVSLPRDKNALGSVKIIYSGNEQEFKAYLIGPKGYFTKDILNSQVDQLPKGMYTLVLTARKPSENFCPKPIEFTID